MGKCPICGEKFLYSFNKANDGTQVCDNESCKIEYNKIILSKGSSPASNNNSGSSEKKSGGMFGGIFEESEFSKEMKKKILEDTSDWRAERGAVIDEINKMVLSSDVTELSNQLNEIVATGHSSSRFPEGKPLKKACYEKMEFGIMKLRQAGANAEADFFEKKRKDIKPGWF